jgi:hypothetical protein
VLCIAVLNNWSSWFCLYTIGRVYALLTVLQVLQFSEYLIKRINICIINVEDIFADFIYMVFSKAFKCFPFTVFLLSQFYPLWSRMYVLCSICGLSIPN